MKNKKAMAAFMVIGLLFSSIATADVNRGLEIAKQRKERDTGWGDSVATMEMVLKNAQGEQSTRILRMSSLEVDNDGDKGITIFDQPRDVKGTAFLSHSHATEPDDQWLYLPALKRVKRISSRNKSGPFMGSEFAYEDLSSFEIEKYTFKYIKDELIDGESTFVVEQFPLDKNSGYTRQIAWIEKKRYIPLKVEFYDRKDSLLKTLTFNGYKQYEGKYWRALSMSMQNHQTAKSTLLTTDKLAFNTGLTDRDFNKNILKRVR